VLANLETFEKGVRLLLAHPAILDCRAHRRLGVLATKLLDSGIEPAGLGGGA